jgi:catechol 2,3-dioxygenase-like lactoylglutathione lyase family enzyme
MTIFTHIVVGTNDINQAATFFDAVLLPLGIKRMSFGEAAEPATSLLYGRDAPALIVTKPINGEPATGANGGTIGLMAPGAEAVDAFHAAALANGGRCEGAPGPRANAGPTAYGAYIRDPNGNKFCAFTFGQ